MAPVASRLILLFLLSPRARPAPAVMRLMRMAEDARIESDARPALRFVIMSCHVWPICGILFASAGRGEGLKWGRSISRRNISRHIVG